MENTKKYQDTVINYTKNFIGLLDDAIKLAPERGNCRTQPQGP